MLPQAGARNNCSRRARPGAKFGFDKAKKWLVNSPENIDVLAVSAPLAAGHLNLVSDFASQ